jgi:hypothetical protein
VSRFWGPHFPDMRRLARLESAVAASLSLEAPITNSGNLDFVVLRARTAGIAGNDITVEFSDDALASGGEIEEDTIALTVHIKYMNKVTTLDDLFALFSSSALVEMTGSWSPFVTLSTADDEFGPENLIGGVEAATTHTTFWGPHFPDDPDEDPPVPPVGPDGVATIFVRLENGASMQMTWPGGICKTYSGLEFRSANLDYPQVAFSGSAYLIGDNVRRIRAHLQRFASQGQAFQLALPWEGIHATGPVTASAPAVKATIDLSLPFTESGALQGTILRAKLPGTWGNTVRVTFVEGAFSPTGEIEEDGQDVTIKFLGTVTTNTNIFTLIAASSTLIEVADIGVNPGDTLQPSDDEFGFTSLSGGRNGGPLLPVDNTSLLDWAVPGQRIAITVPETDDEVTERVIQEVSATGLILDETISDDLCDLGSEVIPTVPVLLDPQQTFDRYATDEDIESWQLQARAVGFGFPAAAMPARLPIEGLATSGVLDGVVLIAKTAGTGGNAITVEFTADALSGVEIEEDVALSYVHVKFEGDIATVGELFTAISGASTLVSMIGTWEDSDVMASSDDEFDEFPMGGGTEATDSTMGVGAEVTTFADLPVFDRGSDLISGASDQMHSMLDIMDLGAEPFAIGSATMPDWGRYVGFSREDAEEHQWLKLFLFVVQGHRGSWWLPTFRHDLVAVEDGPTAVPGSVLPALREGVIVIDSTIGAINTWFPTRYRYVLVEHADESTFLCEIMSVTDNGDGTADLIVEADPEDASARLPASAAIARISWLDLCRFESDAIGVAFSGPTIAMSEMGRVVQQ